MEARSRPIVVIACTTSALQTGRLNQYSTNRLSPPLSTVLDAYTSSLVCRFDLAIGCAVVSMRWKPIAKHS